MIRWPVFFLLALAIYFLGYGLAPRQPAANMAFFVYSEDPKKDAFCYYLFLPAYRVHKQVFKWGDRSFTRYNTDRDPVYQGY